MQPTVSSPVINRTRNFSSSSWYRCRNVNADSMRFALCSGVSCLSGAQFPKQQVLRDNFCNKKREICGKWLASSIIVKRRFSIIRSRTSSTRSPVMMDGLPLCSSCTCCRPAVNCLHPPATHHLLAHDVRPLDLAHLTNFDRRYVLCIQKLYHNRNSQSAGAGKEPSSTAATMLLWKLGKSS